VNFYSLILFVHRLIGILLAEVKIFYWDELIPLTIPATMMMFAQPPYTLSFFLMHIIHSIVINITGSFLYNVMAVNNGHHGPTIVHEGDEFESLDFGVFQTRAIIDRREFDGNLFAVMGYFGLHILHHLFPTLDHADLPKLQGIFHETCKEFSIVYEQQSTVNAFKTQFKQLGRAKALKVE
jgi:fatty acid desaturase